MIDFKRSIDKITKSKDNFQVGVDDIIVRKIEIDDTDLDGEKVMMNFDKGQYFMMNEVGSRIWDIIDKPIKVKEIIETLTLEYEVDEEVCKDAVIEFIERLNKAELINIK